MPRKYINAITGYDGKLNFLFRSKATGQLMVHKVPSEFIAYFKTDQIEKHQRELRRSRYVSAFEVQGEWTRVRFVDWETRRKIVGHDSPLVLAGIQPFEGDVHPIRRYVTDNDVHIAKPRRCYFDIETDSRVAFHEKEKMRILAWTVIDEEGNVAGHYVTEADTDAAEAIALKALWRVLETFDQILAWFGDGFDFPVLWARSKTLGVLPKDIKRWLYLDHLLLFKRMNLNSATSGEEKQSMKLQAIGMAVVGEGKDNFDASKTYEAWATAHDCGSTCGKCRGCMARYNVQDTKLLQKIEKKTGYADLFQAICEITRCFPESRNLQPSFQVDGFMLRLGLEKGIHFPTAYHSHSDIPTQQYEGAFVMEPTERGIVKGVHVADFASMYPSIIMTYNMSPDTKVAAPINGPIPPGLCRNPGNRESFTTERVGILPEALGHLLHLRKHYAELKASLPPGTPEWYGADRLSNGAKVTGNSFYGVMGSPTSRFFDRAIAEGTTTAGQYLLKKTMELAREEGMRPIYADTDSVFIAGVTSDQFRRFVEDLNTKHYPRILAETGVVNNYIKIAYEKEFERIVMVGKKRSCGIFAHYKGTRATADTQPEVKGLEYKRGDTSLLARKLQWEVIKTITLDKCEDPLAFESMIEAWKQRILEGSLSREEVVLVKGLSKDLSEYLPKKKNDGSDGSMLPHIMLAKRLLERRVIATKKTRQGLDVPAGTRIEYIVTDSTAKPAGVIWAEDWDPIKTPCDRYYVWETLVWPPTMRLLEAAFPAHDWAKHNKVRPRKVRAKKGGAGDGQMGLFEAPPPTATRVAVTGETSAIVPSMRLPKRSELRHKRRHEEA